MIKVNDWVPNIWMPMTYVMVLQSKVNLGGLIQCYYEDRDLTNFKKLATKTPMYINLSLIIADICSYFICVSENTGIGLLLTFMTDKFSCI